MRRMVKEGELRLAKEINVNTMLHGKPIDVKYIRDTGIWKAYTRKGDGWVVANPETYNDISLASVINKHMKTNSGQINIVDAYGNGFTNMVYGKTSLN